MSTSKTMKFDMFDEIGIDDAVSWMMGSTLWLRESDPGRSRRRATIGFLTSQVGPCRTIGMSHLTARNAQKSENEGSVIDSVGALTSLSCSHF